MRTDPGDSRALSGHFLKVEILTFFYQYNNNNTLYINILNKLLLLINKS